MPRLSHMDNKIQLLKASLGDNRIKLDELLKYHTFLNQEKVAKFFYIATTRKELVEVLNTAFELKIPFIIYGNATKLLFKKEDEKKLIIRNRTSNIKLGGIKGAATRDGIGIKEALLEVDSGVSLNKLNEYLKDQKLIEFKGTTPAAGTVGGSIFFDVDLQSITQKVAVWQDGDIFDIEPFNLSIKEHIVLSVVLQVRASEI